MYKRQDPGSWEFELNPAGVDRLEQEEIVTLTPGQYGGTPVSYTHLRAHETVLDLVCRLLLEKKKHHTSHCSPNYYQCDV